MTNLPVCPIVVQSDDFLLLNKPTGVAMHAGGDLPTVTELLLAQGISGPLLPVHRLDNGTSGLLLLARHREAAAQLALAFAERRVEKCYVAIARGKPKKKQGLVVGDMQPARNGSYRLNRSKIKPAETRFESVSIEPGYRLYTLWPRTGKTHQLRVALKSQSVPVLGDLRYGGEDADRMYLHALAIRFPWQGEQLSYSAPPQSGERFLRGEVSAMIDSVAGAFLDA